MYPNRFSHAARQSGQYIDPTLRKVHAAALHWNRLRYLSSWLGEQAVKKTDKWIVRSWSLGDPSTRRNGVGYKKEVFPNKSDRSGWEDGWVEKPFKGLLTTVKRKLLKFLKIQKRS